MDRKKQSREMGTGQIHPKIVLQDNYSGSDTSETLIIKDRKSLQKFFSKINRTRKPGIPIPDVDFAKDMILIHCPGEQPLGEQVLFSIANENNRELRLRSSVTRAEKNGESSVIVSPFSVYKMLLTTKNIVFEKED